MSDASLVVETTLALAWQEGLPDADSRRAGQLLLRVVNMLEGAHEVEPSRAQERLEAKMDLLLHWLGEALFASGMQMATHQVRLDGSGVSWRASSAPPLPAEATLFLRLHPDLYAPFKVGVRLSAPEDGVLRGEFEGFDEAQVEQWTQWLFRMHRRAIQQDRRAAGNPNAG